MKYFTAVIAILLFSFTVVKAENQKILVKIKSCDNIKVKVINGSECSEEDYISGPCKNQDECFCISPDKKTKWRIVSKVDNKIKLKFKDENGNKIKAPFLNKCLNDYSEDKVVCKIKPKSKLSREIYDFDVKVKGCPNAHDPRIVIKKTR